MEEIKLNEKELQDECLLDGIDANGEVLELATSYCASLKKFKPLEKEEEKRLFEEYNKTHDPKIKQEIIERHLRFIPWFIKNRNIQIDGMDFMDLVQEANKILLEIFERFDINLGNKFITFFGYSLEQYFRNRKLDNTHFMNIGHTMYRQYLKYLKYKEEYMQEKGCEPTKEEVMKKFHFNYDTYKAFKHMDLTGNTAISLDSTVNSDGDEVPLYDMLASNVDGVNEYNEYIDNKILFWNLKNKLTPLEYYLFYNYTTDPQNYTQDRLASYVGENQVQVSRILKRIKQKIESMNLKDEYVDLKIIRRIDKIDVRPINFPKKVVLIYMKDKLSAEEFFYVYSAWYLDYDDSVLRYKFAKIGLDYKELKESMQGVIDNLNDILNNRYESVFRIVRSKLSVAQIFEKDVTANMAFDYQISKCLDSLSYDEVLGVLGDNYDSLDEAQKRSLYSYYNWKYKWKNVNVREDIEAKINLKRHGFKRKRHVDLNKLYKIYLDNPDMFEESTKEVLEGTLFKQFTQKKGKIGDNSSAYYRSLWRLEEKYYNLDNYFSYDIPEKDYYRILEEYNYIFTKNELYVLDRHSEFNDERATLEEMAKDLDITVNEVDAIYLWAKSKILLLYLGLYSVMVIDNEPLYVEYVNDPKFDITDKAREIGRMRFMEHLSYEEIADKVNLEDDEDDVKKKSKTSKKQKVSNIVTKLIRQIEIHHYNILNEVNMEDEKVINLLDKLNFRGEARNIIRDFYVEKINMDKLKRKYGKTQPEINDIVMRFKRNYITNYKKSVDREDIVNELNEHVTDTVLTEDQRIVLAYMEGIKCSYNPEGNAKKVSEIAEMIKTNEKNVSQVYNKGIFNIGAKLAGIVGSDLGRIKRCEVIEALKDKNLPLTEEEKILIKEFKGIDTDTLSLDELGEKYHVNATSIKRRIQNIYLAILKYQDGKTSKKYDYDEDIKPVLKYMPLYYQKLVTDMYRDNLSNKEIALKYGIEYERIHIETGDANKQLHYLLKCPNAKMFDFDYAREVINKPDLPYYDDETKDVRYIFNRLMGNDGEEPATKKEIQETLGLSSNIKLNVILRKMMVAISKYRDGFRKKKSYTKEEIAEYYKEYSEGLTATCKYFFKRALRDKSQVHKGVNDRVFYELLKCETNKLIFLDVLSKDEIKSLIRNNPYRLTNAQLAYLAFEYGIPSKELMNGRKRRKLYRTLAPYLKDYMLKHGQKLEMKNN